MVLHFVNDPLPAFCMKLDRIVLLSGISQLRRAGFYLAPKFYESAHSIQQSSSCNFRPNRFSPPYPTSATIWRHCCRSCVRWSIHNWHSILPFSLSSSPLHNYIVIPGSNLRMRYIARSRFVYPGIRMSLVTNDRRIIATVPKTGSLPEVLRFVEQVRVKLRKMLATCSSKQTRRGCAIVS